MSSLEALTGTGVYAGQLGGVAAAPAAFVEATIATNPVSVDDEVMVLVGAEGSQLQAGPCRWEPRVIDGGLLFPRRGDPCLVVTGDKGHRAIVWWKPQAPALADPWHVVGSGAPEPVFQNGWSNFDATVYAPASFYRRGDRVHLRGLVKSGSAQVPIFTLPAGYRPALRELFAAEANLQAHARVDVANNGDVLVWGYATGGTNGYLSLAGITFRVA